MLNRLVVLIFLVAAAQCQAGYDEYDLLDFSRCSHLLLTTDAPQPDPESREATDAYRNYLKANSMDAGTLWGLFDSRDGIQYWADCKGSLSLLSCTVIGGLPYKSFVCQLGKSGVWARTCSAVAEGRPALKIYSVDTSEYENGGQPFINRYFVGHRRAMERRCKAVVPTSRSH